MRSLWALFFTLICCASATAAPRTPGATVTLCRKNHMVGYGLVVGLSGTGDDLKNNPMTLDMLKLSVGHIERGDFDPSVFEHTVAVVMVTTGLLSCGYSDGSYDLKVERVVNLKVVAIGDATSLRGGALAMTPLKGADGQIYVMGQGVLTMCPDDTNPNAACIEGGGIVAK
jgi:flagellar P-ring protein precursor FlgI